LSTLPSGRAAEASLATPSLFDRASVCVENLERLLAGAA
jgi:hypothetical protein